MKILSQPFRCYVDEKMPIRTAEFGQKNIFQGSLDTKIHRGGFKFKGHVMFA